MCVLGGRECAGVYCICVSQFEMSCHVVCVYVVACENEYYKTEVMDAY